MSTAISAVALLSLLTAGPKVAVFEFEGVGVDSITATVATSLFRAELANTGKFTVATADEVAGVLGVDRTVTRTSEAQDAARRIGAAKAVTDVLGGHVDAIFSMVVPLVPHAAGGDLKLLAVTTKTRSPALPDVPTVAETTALKNFDVVNWTALLAPAGTPDPIIQKLAAATAEALRDPDLLARFATLGVAPAGDGPHILGEEIRRTVALWRAVVAKSGIKVN